MGKLYVVGTPIGNLGDMTYRAVETLKSVDFICAEDTRVTAKLLNYFKIDTPTISYHEHNAKTAGETVLNRILAGENGAIVTDAGMPCISDPGEDLVKLCAENNVEINVVPQIKIVTNAARCPILFLLSVMVSTSAFICFFFQKNITINTRRNSDKHTKILRKMALIRKSGLHGHFNRRNALF